MRGRREHPALVVYLNRVHRRRRVRAITICRGRHRCQSRVLMKSAPTLLIMTAALQRGPLAYEVGLHYPYGYAVVDVETSGLRPSFNRVLQIAVVQVSSDGGVESAWSTLLNPGCDPGPVDIHGLTRQRLAGAPLFPDVSNHLVALLAGRVLVAHNARFDWSFLEAEADRAHVDLAIVNRLCTIAFTRRLDVPLGSLSLASVASYWGVPQRNAHDAVDDTRVLVEVLRHSLALADRLGVPLPLTPCTEVQERTIFPTAAPRPPCPWRYPGRWTPGTPLQQGMKLVFTGDTRSPRDVLVRTAADAGLDVMNSVSSKTSLAVCNDSQLTTRKAELARHHGTPLITEDAFQGLLPMTRAGESKPLDDGNQRVLPATPAEPAPPTPIGPLTRHRVLIVGGSHDEAAALRQRVAELGGQGAANLTATVTDVVGLAGCERDPRWQRVVKLGVTQLHADTLQPDTDSDTLETDAQPRRAATPAIALPASAPLETIVLPRGGATDLPTEVDQWALSVNWPDGEDRAEIDVVAFIVDSDEQVSVDHDFCFYNNPSHPSGAIELDFDTPAETVALICPDALPAGQTRVVIAASIDGDTTFGAVGPIEVVLRTADGLLVVRATLDAAIRERSLILANLYQRNGTWRFRAVGQGYRTGLAALAVLHGVDIEED
jgi:DNA polymerase III subunit epsilon